jgi:hypothetical protein
MWFDVVEKPAEAGGELSLSARRQVMMMMMMMRGLVEQSDSSVCYGL